MNPAGLRNSPPCRRLAPNTRVASTTPPHWFHCARAEASKQNRTRSGRRMLAANRLVRVARQQARRPGLSFAGPAETSAPAGATAAPAASGRFLARSPMWLLRKSGSSRACSSWARSKLAAGLSSSRLGGVRGATKMKPGNRNLSSFLPRGGGYSDSMIVYGIVGVSCVFESCCTG